VKRRGINSEYHIVGVVTFKGMERRAWRSYYDIEIKVVHVALLIYFHIIQCVLFPSCLYCSMYACLFLLSSM
jgi:hypothetical protein